jgi:hypothetical protein
MTVFFLAEYSVSVRPTVTEGTVPLTHHAPRTTQPLFWPLRKIVVRDAC